MRRHSTVAAIRFLQQQNELVDRFAAGEVAGLKMLDERSDLTPTDVDVPSDDDQPIDRRAATAVRRRSKQNGTDGRTPFRQYSGVLLIGCDPEQMRIGVGR